MTSLNSLKKILKKKIRPGRGIGSGKGKTSGRGHKGQKSRSGVAIKSFEGGQMPLYRRLPKRGFNSLSKIKVAEINLNKIQEFIEKKIIKSDDIISLDSLKKAGLIRKNSKRLKILGNGEIKDKITIKANLISKSAKEKLEKKGGSFQSINK
ncbi:MAG: 50S ribosomal protein L15 [Candidatus Pelagibacter sp. TMED273]|nr:MAG: 50S ribosomal protein L15 [Candidatus Pelagibacter sp. TMED273]|tara:strand:+ start:1423 stop:1878 length:456 start_codon:yes stop_codon:yes gene_type:complete